MARSVHSSPVASSRTEDACRASDGEIGSVSVLDHEQACFVIMIEHVRVAHKLFGDHVAEWKKTIAGYLKVILPSPRGYLMKVDENQR